MNQTLHDTLSDPKVPFAQKLLLAAASELIYWEERHNPPNLSVHEFRRILPLIPVQIKLIWEPRKSRRGKYGETGQKQIFKFDFEISLLGQSLPFFIKGYFFEEGCLRGVEIQSFRRESL